MRRRVCRACARRWRVARSCRRRDRFCRRPRPLVTSRGRHPSTPPAATTRARARVRRLGTTGYLDAVNHRPPHASTGIAAHGAAASSGALSVEVLQELVRCELDLLVPPLRRTVLAGDQSHPVQTAEVAVDKRVARLRLLGRALRKAEMPGGVLLRGVRLQERVLLPCARLHVLPARAKHVLPRVDQRLTASAAAAAMNPAVTLITPLKQSRTKHCHTQRPLGFCEAVAPAASRR